MAQKLDLGHSTLRIRNSKLQLRLAASAYFTQPPSHGSFQIELPELENLESVWITEAPELELRFFVGGDWDGTEMTAFVSRLSSRLCNMEIWSDLGFSVESKAAARGYCIDTSGFHYLGLGLRRECRVRNHTTGRTLPSSMTNPPDACPPHSVPVATLASIDIRLEYRLHTKDISQSQGCSDLEIGLLGQEPSIDTSFQVLDRMAEAAMLHPTHDEDSTEALGPQTACVSGDGSAKSWEELFRLLDLGIQRLVISTSIKDRAIRVSQQDTIKSLADISPAVFNPAYRNAVNQRGVTIPIITKAISAMLAGNKDQSTKAKLADLLELNRCQSTNDLTMRSQLPSCRTAILSSLWRVAQNNAPKMNSIKRRASMFSMESLSNGATRSDEPVRLMSAIQQQPDNENPGQHRSFQTQYHNEDEVCDVYLLNSEPEDQLLDNFSETSFTDLGDSTQTSLDTVFSSVGCSQASYRDYDTMLLSDDGELTDYPGNNVGDYDPGEYMETYDTDIIMADDL
ncbi:hypothetical protein N7516_005993 [Penicillium verrucosum]|uniref:uncharacterized protein n=1 Tax=Penicillium verrucosum TaxID=60171 RepID=UPI002544EDE7|nr:uncharacterized protein N7516_005993 [Penicillium verrucosum]KAJ5931504.1 hypothetical protein N7516_005993 [Penicillium verrucosum]